MNEAEIIRRNIRRYRRMLQTETDEAARRAIHMLLAESGAKLIKAEVHQDVQQYPDVSAEERASHEFVKQILKLRWIGKHLEAEQMLLSALQQIGPDGHPVAHPRISDRD